MSALPSPIRSRTRRDANVSALADLYESTTFEAVHEGVLDLLPERTSDVLDVGAGSGRDAAWLARRGHRVTAVEPSGAMLVQAKRRHHGMRVSWVRDELPDLSSLMDRRFDFVLVSAVWMYVRRHDRRSAMTRLSSLIGAAGRLVLTARLGDVDLHRGMEPTSVDEVLSDAAASGLQVERSLPRQDALGRQGVLWSTFVFRPEPMSIDHHEAGT